MVSFDTNILIYAVSGDQVEKREAATALLRRLADEESVILWQVLVEFGAVVRRLEQKRAAHADSAVILEATRKAFPLVMPDPEVFDDAVRISRDHQVSYWDALLIAGCRAAGVKTLWSEDRQSRPEIDGVRIINPFIGISGS